MTGSKVPFFHLMQPGIVFRMSYWAKVMEAQLRVSQRLRRSLIKEIKVTKRKEHD